MLLAAVHIEKIVSIAFKITTKLKPEQNVGEINKQLSQYSTKSYWDIKEKELARERGYISYKRTKKGEQLI